MKPSLVYFGTPELAVPPLRALVESGTYDVLAVVTQTDKPAGRGKALTSPPVKVYAETAGIPVFQPKTLRGIQRKGTNAAGTPEDLVAALNARASIDAFVVVAYGKILPPALISLPRAGILNIHMSLLPKWRGAAPIQRSILAGDITTGVTIMQIDEGLDTGGIFAVAEVPITLADDSGSLSEKLVREGTALLLQTLPEILSGALLPKPQPSQGVSYAEKVSKEDFRIHWDECAGSILNKIRAGSPHPGAWAMLGSDYFKLYKATESSDKNYGSPAPGTVVESNSQQLIIAAGKGTFVSLLEAQLPGKKRLPIGEILKGKKIPPGTVLT